MSDHSSYVPHSFNNVSTEEEDYPMLEKPQPKTASHSYRRQLSILGVLYVVGILATLVIQQRIILRQMQRDIPTSSSTIPATYIKDRRYMTLDRAYDSLWGAWEDGAQVEVPDEITGGTIPAAISMYHQLHCLRSLRSALQLAYYGGSVAFDWHENEHWPHCLDYLRLTILCFADDTIERPVVAANGTRLRQIDGMQTVRQCRSKQRIDDLLNESGLAS